MIDIGLDPQTHDLAINDFDLVLIDNSDQVAQNLLIRLRFILAEWYLDITQGIPYYEDFFIKAPNEIRIESVLKEEIMNTNGIAEILDFTSDFDATNRTYAVKFRARTFTGEIVAIEEELP